MKRALVSLTAVITVLVLAAAGQQAWAQRPCVATVNSCLNQTVTTSKIQIGGAGSLSSNGPSYSNPGRLDDGTIAEADLTFTFDRSTGRLTLLVENKTTTTASLTGWGFNTTSDVTMMSLVSHNGTLPWELAFDQNRSDNVVDSHPTLKELRMDGFGRFSVVLMNKGIDTGPGGGDHREILAGQSITYVIQVTGNINNLTACSFTSVGSLIPPGDKIVTAVGRFQSGVNGGSGFIGPCTGGSLLVTLADFDVANDNGELLIRWKTASEIDNAGFALLLRNVRRSETTRLNSSLIPGQGSEVSGASYEYREKNVLAGVKYHVMLEDWDLSGVNTIHPPKTVVPNPVNTKIRLVSPAYEERAGAQVKMSWTAQGRMNAVIEVSANPTFPSDATLRLPAGARTSRSLNPREIDLLDSMAAGSPEGGVYWRVSGRDASGAQARSQTWFLTIGN